MEERNNEVKAKGVPKEGVSPIATTSTKARIHCTTFVC